MSPQYDADYNDYSHVVAVGYSLLESLPAEVGNTDQAYLPFIWSAVSDHYGENFGQCAVESGREPVFIAPIAGYTPPSFDLHRGDMLVEFDGKKVSSCIALKKLLEKMPQKKSVRVGFQKEDGIQFYDVPLLYFRTRLYFSMMGNVPGLYCEYVPDKQFFVISKKLVHLIQNDDELAYLMAHDLAHKMKGHKRTKTPDPRTFGYNMVTTGIVTALLLPDYAWVPYESKDERDAAMEAPIYLANAKYDVNRGEKILDRMKPLITDRDTSWFYIHLGENPPPKTITT